MTTGRGEASASAAAAHHSSHVNGSGLASIIQAHGGGGCSNSFCQAISVPSLLTAVFIFLSGATALMKTTSSRANVGDRGPNGQAKIFHFFFWASFFLQRFCRLSLALHDIFLLFLHLSFLLRMSVPTLSSTKGDLHMQINQVLLLSSINSFDSSSNTQLHTSP